MVVVAVGDHPHMTSTVGRDKGDNSEAYESADKLHESD